MSGESKPRIGFIGLGIMGAGMARNFLGKGFPLVVWNRTPARAAPLVEAGAQAADTPRAVAERCDVLVSSLSTPQAVLAAAGGSDGVLAGARRGLKWIETSTIGTAATLALAESSAELGVDYLEAPVTGSKVGAREGTLVVMTGGSAELHAACEPVLRAFAQKLIHVGPIGTASVMKLIGNTLISFMLQGLSESVVLGERAGISIEKILEVVQASGFASPYWSFKGNAMARRDFETHFSLELLHKDQALALAEGATRLVPMSGLAAIHQVTASALALGLGREDIAAQLEAVEHAAASPRR